MSATSGGRPPEEAGPGRREPIRRPWPWVGLGVIVLAGVPWYLPPGTVGPVVLGLPLWALVAVASSVAVAAYLSWMLSHLWNVVEDVEESAGEPVGPDTPLDDVEGKGQRWSP
ncbi:MULTISPECIES: hypothetical protein [Streptomonospora]|uniref:DUF3311 domain-containing protein n=2 Tax=Streptomonospora TaxID=104204 RepID=A0ABV9SHR8_9ACTN